MTPRERFLAMVANELEQQDNKWGAGRDHHPDKWIRIAVEELGEAAAEIEAGDPHAFVVEAIQCAASMVQACESVSRQDWNHRPPGAS